MRKKIFCIALALLVSLGMASCKKKEKPADGLTPMNALEKYGGVMGSALKKSKAMDDVLYMKNKINTFQIQEGRYPYSLNELVEKKYLEKLPEPPKGATFHYDASSGTVEAK